MGIALAGIRDSFRQLGHRSDYLVSFGTEGATLALGFFVFKLAASYWGPVGFGEYVLVRRAVALLSLPISCGMAVGVTRFVAASASRSGVRRYGRAAITIVVVASIVGLSAINVAPGQTARLFFGEATYAPLVWPLSVAVFGMVLHGVAYGLFRGRFQLVRANALQFINIGAVPLFVFLAGGLEVSRLVLMLGGIWVAVAVIALLIGLQTPRDDGQEGLGGAARELLTYGLPRIPGEFALAALFALPAILTAHLGDVATAGYVGFATSLLTMMGSVFAPVGVIVLPSASQAIANGQSATLWRDVRRITYACVAAAGFLVLGLELVSGLVVGLGLGPGFAAAITPVRIVLLGGMPFVGYIVLRNVLDAASVWPFNARNLLVAVAAMVAQIAVFQHPNIVPVALASSVALLGALSVRDTRRLLRGNAAP
jgi:O-antigen/teichoic acid export membrane protein